jgi:hypothetical protein
MPKQWQKVRHYHCKLIIRFQKLFDLVVLNEMFWLGFAKKKILKYSGHLA